MKQVCVIGSGITGLTAAWELAKAGFTVQVLESTLQAGGMVSAFNMGADRIEHIYHHIFTSDQHVRDLIEEMGLTGQLQWYHVRDALYAGNTLYPFSSPLDLLRFKEIPLSQRLRTGLTVLKAGRLRDWQALEKITAAGWIKVQSGETAYQKLWQPLLRAKFDLDAEEVSAVWLWNKFKLRGNSRSHDLGDEKLGYLQGSFYRLIDALMKSIEGSGGHILFGYTVMNIQRVQQDCSPNTYRISCILEDCSSVDLVADAVIATTSGRQFTNLSTGLDLPEDYLQRVRSVRYKGDLCVILRLRRSLSPYYWTTICDDLPFVVVIEHTNLTGVGQYGGHVLYLSRYLDVADRLWTLSDGEILKLFMAGLTKIYPDFSSADIIDWRMKRTRYAQPVIYRDYTDLMPAMDTPEPGVKLAGMAQIYPEDRGMNYAVRLGLQAARSVCTYLTGPARTNQTD